MHFALVGAHLFGVFTDSSVRVMADKPDRQKLEAAQEEFFETKIRPLLADNCLECHGAEKHKGGLRLDRSRRHAQGG